MRILVRTPATAANLGPGFDCLGLALDLWNEMEVSTTGDRLKISIDGEGRDVLPVDETNAIYQAMHSFALQQGKDLPAGIQIRCQNKFRLDQASVPVRLQRLPASSQRVHCLKLLITRKIN
jgi:homoserine kinase